MFTVCYTECLCKVLENREGSRFTPACVSFKGGEDPFVGNLARAKRFEVQCLLAIARTKCVDVCVCVGRRDTRV